MRSLLKKLLLMLFGIAVALLLAEVVARVVLPPVPSVLTDLKPSTHVDAPEGDPGSGPQVFGSEVDEGTALVVRTPSGKRLRRNAHVIIQNHYLCRCTVEIRTNSLGYRNAELTARDKNTVRVLFLGDSITLAASVPEEETWVRQVERMSETEARPLEAINAGVWAVGLANELSILQETGLSTEPDVVVLGFYLNDFETSPGVVILRPPDYLTRSVLAQQIFYRSSFLRPRFTKTDYSNIPHETLMEWKARMEEQFPPGETTHDYRTNPEGFNRIISKTMFDWGGAWSDDVWDHLSPLVAEFKRQSVLHHFRPRIVMFPVENQISAEYVYDYPQQRMKSLAEDLKIPFLDLLPVIRRASRESEERLFYDWCHHTPAGQKYIADAVYEFLKKTGF